MFSCYQGRYFSFPREKNLSLNHISHILSYFTRSVGSFCSGTEGIRRDTYECYISVDMKFFSLRLDNSPVLSS